MNQEDIFVQLMSILIQIQKRNSINSKSNSVNNSQSITELIRQYQKSGRIDRFEKNDIESLISILDEISKKLAE